jgi:hypothetical protein
MSVKRRGWIAKTLLLVLGPWDGGEAAGAINATTVAFDFDYDNNVQGGRTAGTDAAVVLVAAGLEAAQVAVASGLTITRATGLSFSVTAATERNYSNP